ncbi:hypothetical protein PSSHI_25860 [Photobacterium sp. R1]
MRNRPRSEFIVDNEKEDVVTNTNRTTRLLMSAAHLYPDDFKEDLKERLGHPYKSSAPEYGVELNKISQELEKAKVSHFGKSAFIFIVVLIFFFIFIEDPKDNWVMLIPALALTSIAEFIYNRSAKKKARLILAGENKDDEENKTNKKNIMISGGYSPFVGAGIDLDSWSFTINTKEAEDKSKPVKPVSVTELHEQLKKRLLSLGIDDIEITDELYINGKDVNLVAYLLPNGRLSKPVDNVDLQYINTKINNDDKRERHYRVVRIPMWDGQMILSVYYRFLSVKDNLFTEARFFLLPPLKEKYLAIDEIPLKPTGKEFGESLIQSIFTGAFSWIGVVINVLTFVQGGFMADSARQKGWKRELESNRLYNYGWDSSLREKWSSVSFERYFQKVDKDVALKLVTSEFLGALREYLEKNNISTEQFSQTSTKIVNEGVMISGGEVKADSFAVGKGASIAKDAIKAVKGGGNKS